MSEARLRRTKYAPSRRLPSDGLLEAIKEKALRDRVLGFNVFVVNELAVVAYVDPDFTAGGNFARYAYVPMDELWIASHKPQRAAAVMVHEAVECHLMLHGIAYPNAHTEASRWEVFAAREILEGCVRVATWQEATCKAEEVALWALDALERAERV